MSIDFCEMRTLIHAETSITYVSRSYKLVWNNSLFMPQYQIKYAGKRGPSSPFYRHRLSLIPAWISNYIRFKVWDEIT